MSKTGTTGPEGDIFNIAQEATESLELQKSASSSNGLLYGLGRTAFFGAPGNERIAIQKRTIGTEAENDKTSYDLIQGDEQYWAVVATVDSTRSLAWRKQTQAVTRSGELATLASSVRGDLPKTAELFQLVADGTKG